MAKVKKLPCFGNREYLIVKWRATADFTGLTGRDADGKTVGAVVLAMLKDAVVVSKKPSRQGRRVVVRACNNADGEWWDIHLCYAADDGVPRMAPDGFKQVVYLEGLVPSSLGGSEHGKRR